MQLSGHSTRPRAAEIHRTVSRGTVLGCGQSACNGKFEKLLGDRQKPDVFVALGAHLTRGIRLSGFASLITEVNADALFLVSWSSERDERVSIEKSCSLAGGLLMVAGGCRSTRCIAGYEIAPPVRPPVEAPRFGSSRQVGKGRIDKGLPRMRHMV